VTGAHRVTEINARPSSRILPAWAGNLGILLVIAAMWPLNKVIQDQINPYVVQILTLIGINIVMATSLNLINGITGQFSLGHAGFAAVGAYTTGVVINYLAAHDSLAGHEWIAMSLLLPLGGLIAAAMGLLVGIPTLRLKGDYLAVATLGFGEIIRIVITNTNAIGPFEVRGSQGLRVPVLADLFWVYLWVAVCVAGIWRLVHSTMGKAFLAVREDEIAATAMGVNTTFFKVLAFAIGAFFAGVAGGLQATAFILIDPKGFGFIQSVLFVVMVVLGGSGSITGVVLAAVVLTWLPEQLRSLKSLHVEDLRMVIFSLLLIGMMLVRPEGLLGRRELWWTRRKMATAQIPRSTDTAPPISSTGP
jgi:branched-chain amino acid transport system permease protein